MDKQFIKRKNYVIDKQFQFRFVATFLAIIVISLLLFSAGFALVYWVKYLYGDNVFKEYFIAYRQVEVLESGEPVKDENGNPVTTTIEEPVGSRTEIILPPLLINNLVIMVLISIIGLFYSHRIAGPAYRIETDITKVLNGEKGVRIKLRKYDKLVTLADKVNLLLDKLENGD